MNPGYRVEMRVTGCLAAIAIKVSIGQLSGTLIFLPQYQAKGLVICNDFEINGFPTLLLAILQPTCFIVLYCNILLESLSTLVSSQGYKLM
jgi:hypothetical protein